MNSIVVFDSRWMSISSSVTAACTETSSAETGSSATTTFGLAGEGARHADALLLAARQLPRHAGRRRRAAASPGRAAPACVSRRSARVLPILNFSSVRMICEPTEWLGLSVSNGFWNTIWMTATFRVAVLDRAWTGSRLLPSVILPAVAVSSPSSTLASVDLPQPDSPTIATVSDSRASKVIDLVGLDGARLAAAEDRVGGDLVVFLQIVDLQHRRARARPSPWP